METTLPLDCDLIRGFRFRCLPGCGLCCYTTPAASPDERLRLIQLDPHAPFEESSEGRAVIRSRPEGGACHFLRAQRCTCHVARPGVCGQFPLTVHVGSRIQVSVVLTCPGVDLRAIASPPEGADPGLLPPDLHGELEYVKMQVQRASVGGQIQAASNRWRAVERRLTRRGNWQSPDEIRRNLRPRLNELIPTDLEEVEVPEPEEPIESMPLFFEPGLGLVGWRPHPGGVELLAPRETGGVERHLGVIAPPTRSPGLSGPGWGMLTGYLAYLLGRDATIGVAYDYLRSGEPVLPQQVVAEDLQAIADQVLRLAAVRRALTTDRRGELTAPDVENGIRATDMDILDRPTVGLRL